ncbi:Uncharacterised protein [Mycobacteroides abscessus subsp. massiliense]|nr:Uncharacterised protein [Mycobacteroides abscessus subsp. abscessus]SLA51822.1 Uncharacterised protein [Mycobacteroides abscessus subsp. massiliense]
MWGASRILLLSFPSVLQYIVTAVLVAEISRFDASRPRSSLTILLTASFCFCSSAAMKSLHLVSPPRLTTPEQPASSATAAKPVPANTFRAVMP